MTRDRTMWAACHESALRLARPVMQSIRRLLEALKRRSRFTTWRTLAALVGAYVYDGVRFWRHASLGEEVRGIGWLDAHMTMDYHRIEKGLSLRHPRIGFGRDVIWRLLKNLEACPALDSRPQAARHAIRVLRAYNAYGALHGQPDTPPITQVEALAEILAASSDVASDTAIVDVSRESILDTLDFDYSAFVHSRHSVRDFALGEVDMTLIWRALELAQCAPSACNRQCSRAYVVASEELRREVLSIQNGNRGFGAQADKLLLITCDLQRFVSVEERNQGWVDGGIYTMSLLSALHSLGLGACCLNWCVDRKRDRHLRSLLELPDKESILVMIAVGHLAPTFRATLSPRRRVEEIVRVL